MIFAESVASIRPKGRDGERDDLHRGGPAQARPLQAPDLRAQKAQEAGAPQNPAGRHSPAQLQTGRAAAQRARVPRNVGSCRQAEAEAAAVFGHAHFLHVGGLLSGEHSRVCKEPRLPEVCRHRYLQKTHRRRRTTTEKR